MIHLAVYERRDDGYFVEYVPIDPTGKWRLRTSPYWDGVTMDIQVRGGMFKRWVNEDAVVFRQARTCVEFSCHD